MSKYAKIFYLTYNIMMKLHKCLAYMYANVKINICMLIKFEIKRSKANTVNEERNLLWKPKSLHSTWSSKSIFWKTISCQVLKSKKYHSKVLMGKFHWNAWPNYRILPQRPESTCIVSKDNNWIDCFVYGSAW